MSDPRNVQILQDLLNKSSDLFLEYFYRLEIAFKQGLWFKMRPFLGEEDHKRTFEQLLVGFFDNHSTNFMLVHDRVDVVANHFFEAIPIWIEDILRLEIYEIEGNVLIADKEFRFKDIPDALVERCFENELVHQNPEHKYYARITLIQESQKRIVDTSNFEIASDSMVRKQEEVIAEMVSLIKETVEVPKKEEDQGQRTRRLVCLQHRLELWGLEVNLFDYHEDRSIQLAIRNLNLSSFGFREVFALERLKKTLLLPMQNQELINSIHKNLNYKIKKMEELFDRVTAPKEES